MRSDVPGKPPGSVTLADFLKWEAETHDVLDFKKMYVDMARDLHGGIVLSEIVYWYLPAKDGKTRLRVRKQGRMWIAVRRWEWWDRARMTPRQADRGLGKLLEAGLIDKAIFKFDGEPTTHVALNEAVFLAAWARCLEQPEVNPFLPDGEARSRQSQDESPVGESGLPREASPLTETTAQTTAVEDEHSVGNADLRGAVATEGEEDFDLLLLADAFSDFAGLGPVPEKGDTRYADWWQGYGALLSICMDMDVLPPILALLCAMKRDELSFHAGSRGAYLKTAQDIAAALADRIQRPRLLGQLRRYIDATLTTEKKKEWRDWIHVGPIRFEFVPVDDHDMPR